MFCTEATGATVEHFTAHFSAIALGCSRTELETDFAPGRPPWLAPLLHVLAGSGL
jgi:hypothetical protein